MKRTMTVAAEDNQILIAIGPRLTSRDEVMNVQLIASTTARAFPAVALQDFVLQLLVMLRCQAKATFLKIATHAS